MFVIILWLKFYHFIPQLILLISGPIAMVKISGCASVLILTPSHPNLYVAETF